MFTMMPFGFLFIFILTSGSLLSISSIHWLSIWAGLEINLMGFIPILVYRGITQEAESGMKYFIIQALGSGMIMLGSLVSFNASLSWEVMLTNSPYGGLLLIFTGLMLKLGSFPFHFWLPSVMAGLSWVSCLILTTWQKLAPVFLLASMLQGWLMQTTLMPAMILLASMSALVGGIGGLNQTQVRALLAYSSIGHVGWMIFCSTLTENVMKIYFLIYFIVSICLFTVLWHMENSLFSQIGSDYSAKSKSHELILIFMLLSLSGMPPLLGFIGKWAAVWSSCYMYSPALLVPLLVGSLLSLFYYLSLLFSLLLFSGMTLTTKSTSGGDLPPLANEITPLSTYWANSTNIFNSSLQQPKMSLWITSAFILNLVGGSLISMSLPLTEFL
uniref:NADH-ubiquinone oxidoreductase chain 2 n=1 Tax=Margarites vorticiferus TaxID=1172988 RepID=A0A1W5YRR1_9VEST|nr:NADH dehydrogenase subunit 2 [Margarites vorticiferus]